MNYRTCGTILNCILLCLFFTGCASNPVSIDGDVEPNQVAACVSETASHYPLGFYALVIDTEANAIDAIPVRSANLHLNLTDILNTTMGVSAVSVPSEANPAIGLFVFDITLTHPFGTKKQLAGFDVKGILMTPGSLTIDSKVFADADETRLGNADGYTRWWNPTEFTSPGMFGYTQGVLANAPGSALTATVNPYKYFADAFSNPDDPMGPVHGEPLDSDTGRGVFTAGSSNTRRYRIQFPMAPGPQVVFGYAIDACWAKPTPNPPDDVPDDFPIEANMPEAFDIHLKPLVNTLYYDSESGIGGGVLRLRANVHDWQGQLAGDIPGEVDGIQVFVPDMFAGGVSLSYLNESATKVRYYIDLTGTAVPKHSGNTVLAVKVGSNGGPSYDQGVAPAPSDNVAAWEAMSLDIPDPECVGDANDDWLEAVEIAFGDPIADQVCLPDDYRDYYWFEVLPGHELTGEIRLYCDAEPTKLGLYDSSQTLITEASVSSGIASIAFDGLDLWPGQYYIRVLTSNSTQTSPYLLELTGELLNIYPDTPVDVTPGTLYVKPRRIWVHGNYAFLIGYGVWVYDISNPLNPVQLVHERIPTSEDACFLYPYLYFSDRVGTNELQVNMIDFTDPTAPVLHEDLIHYMDDPAAIAMNSTHLYVGTSTPPISEVLIYEYATDPLNPTHVGNLGVPYEPNILELMDPEGSETRLVVGTLHDVLTFDVEDPLSITPTGIYNFPTGALRSITVQDNYMYVGWSDSGEDGYLYVLAQGIGSISKLGDVDIPGGAYHITHEWPYVYFGDSSAGLTICEVTTASAPTYVSSTNLISWGADLAVDNDTVYIIPLDAGLQVMDVSTPLTPVPLTRLPVVNSAYAMELKDGYLLVAEVGSGTYGAIKTVDISDPANASVVADYYPPDRPTDLSLYGDTLATAGSMNWMLYDASDPLDIQPCSSTAEVGVVYEIGLYGDAIYVFLDLVGYPVKIYDISNPYSPNYESTMLINGDVRDFTFIGGYMYVVVSGDIEIYSIVNPFVPVYIDTYGYSAFGFKESEIHGDHLYIATLETLEIADISTPSSPVHVGSELFPVDGSYYYSVITVEGQFGYMTGYNVIPQSCLLYPLDDPTVIGPVYEGNTKAVRDILALNGFLYEATEYTGLHIFDLY